MKQPLWHQDQELYIKLFPTTISMVRSLFISFLDFFLLYILIAQKGEGKNHASYFQERDKKKLKGKKEQLKLKEDRLLFFQSISSKTERMIEALQKTEISV